MLYLIYIYYIIYNVFKKISPIISHTYILPWVWAVPGYIQIKEISEKNKTQNTKQKPWFDDLNSAQSSS
ncbi:hypothetical protein QVD17_15862 [Tagetes erecta]|uniref:Uncharacterized protein n=1 Tax=Tagetes erecta TaxID=13708 RepID=A0AAD8KQX5_TARER|nr:hypothetical protein QVD17_15862 [Tagetes erecta]